MTKIPSHRPKRWLTGAAAGLATFTGGERLAAAPWVHVSTADRSIQRTADSQIFSCGYEGVLGTSLDLFVEAPRASDALACESHLLREIERLRKILSTYDPTSEIRRVMAGEPVRSPELEELLAAYETWGARTHRLIAVNLGGVAEAWRAAARAGRLPDRAALRTAAERARAWNVDALGKGFIIERAVAVARRFAPGGLLNIGGDIRAWGDTAWPLGVADPRCPAENAPPLARFSLRESAVATSGSDARFFEINGKRLSHLIDPRTLSPLDGRGSATVIAADAVTANALSTAASIGGPETGASLARTHGAAGYLFADIASGKTSAGGVFAAAATPPTTASSEKSDTTGQPAKPDNAENPSPTPAAAPWPANYQVTVPIVLKKHTGPREIFRPYVVVWIENTEGNVVRTLTLWGTESRWQGKLSKWSYLARTQRRNDPLGTTRPTRPAGTYTVTWDGTDDFGRRLPAGTYKLSLEVCREDGHHVVETVTLDCNTEPVSAAWRETAESDAATVSYGPKT